jgi:ribosomal protein S18 acetylase RimI-like enzyme
VQGVLTNIKIHKEHVGTPRLVAEIELLFRQLSASAASPSLENVRQVIQSPATKLFVARDASERAISMLTLVIFRIPTGLRAITEDVVVDVSVRGKGVGKALTEAAIEEARMLGARTIDLTSRPSREAANRLYQNLGFERRETHVYRFLIRPE